VVPGVDETEADFQTWVVDILTLGGWMYYHTYSSLRSNEGFPDLVCTRPPEILYAELKSEKGLLTPEQYEWLAALQACNQEAYLWRPSDREEIEGRLLKQCI
jgi:hypothetical protein